MRYFAPFVRENPATLYVLSNNSSIEILKLNQGTYFKILYRLFLRHVIARAINAKLIKVVPIDKKFLYSRNMNQTYGQKADQDQGYVGLQFLRFFYYCSYYFFLFFYYEMNGAVNYEGFFLTLGTYLHVTTYFKEDSFQHNHKLVLSLLSSIVITEFFLPSNYEQVEQPMGYLGTV